MTASHDASILDLLYRTTPFTLYRKNLKHSFGHYYYYYYYEASAAHTNS